MDNIKGTPNIFKQLNKHQSKSVEPKYDTESIFFESKYKPQYTQQSPTTIPHLVKGIEILSEDLEARHGSNMANIAIHDLSYALQQLNLKTPDMITTKFMLCELPEDKLRKMRQECHGIEKNQNKIKLDTFTNIIAKYIEKMNPEMRVVQSKFEALINYVIKKYKESYPNSNITFKSPPSLKNSTRVAQKIIEGTSPRKLDDLVRGTIIAPLDEQADFIKSLNLYLQAKQQITLTIKNRISKQTSMGFGDIKCGIDLYGYNCELLVNSPIMNIVKGSTIAHKIYEYIRVMPESPEKDQYKQAVKLVLNDLEVRALRFEYVKMNEFGKEQYIQDIIPFIENMLKKLDINNKNEKYIKFTELIITQKIEHIESLMALSKAFGTAILYGLISQHIRDFAIKMKESDSKYKTFIDNHLNYVPHENYTVQTKLNTLVLLASIRETYNQRTPSQEKYFSKDEDKREEFGASYVVKYSLVNKHDKQRKFVSIS